MDIIRLQLHTRAIYERIAINHMGNILTDCN